MSIEASPNLHAVGLHIDILNAVVSRLRGEAAQGKPLEAIMARLNTPIREFVLDLDHLIDALVSETTRVK